MWILFKTQCCVVCDGKECTIRAATLPLHIDEPKFKALLLSAQYDSIPLLMEDGRGLSHRRGTQLHTVLGHHGYEATSLLP